ncbi:MAG: indolepyruvate ferredoxin oxidoreductase family protein [Rhodospirillales bacterium]|nr:indolepyruvate ferredoxin oxidoreductase family protein [Rhodospirillales bacterium]
MGLLKVSLDHKYTLDNGRIFLTGTQALVRLTLMQRQRDQANGINSAGYVTGYRGSPLGGMDKEFHRAKPHLDAHHVKFHPAVNEDLAATAIWGTQQINLYPDANYDGVFSLWYGKGPGVDRSGDVFRHANYAGTAPHGGVLLLAGDDPACKSSTVPSQSEHALIDANIPVLNPINVQEVLDFGLYGWAMSRYSGCWVGMKCITDNIDTSASVSVDPNRVQINYPTDFEMPADGLHIRWPDPPLDQELRLQRYKIYAALAFARVNKLNHVTIDSKTPRIGIVSTGKSYLDTLQALDDLEIDQKQAEQIGIRLYKVGMPWPLEPDGIRKFAEGLDEIIVIEEKRAVIENQLKELLYNWNPDIRPRVVGKFDETGEWILPSAGELTPAGIARVIADRIHNFYDSPAIRERLAFLESKERALAERKSTIQRTPSFCSGCPHNTSTKVPEGSRALAGIGCHYMVIWQDRNTSTFTHMGGEGVPWIGQSPFTNTEHVFTNLGDGTYYHSGIMAIRASVAAGVNITYKILYNDAVAMTGGQSMDGPLDPAIISRQVSAEGAKRVVVVTDEPDKYPIGTHFADGVSIRHRDDLDAVQKELRQNSGVTVLIYDQTCAAEKRRRRKRGLYPDPAKRVFINDAVCEGCGDCGMESNCVSITPVETELGRKRAIDQSSCNKDFRCLDGFCPSFVTVEGAEPRRRNALQTALFETLPVPALKPCDTPYSIVVTGIGGTGVITVGAVLSMAAHMENKGVTVLDMAGLAQKNGAVYSHLRIAENPEKLHAVRISAGGADLLLGCDLVTAGSTETLGKLHDGETRAIVNTHEIMTTDFASHPDMEFPENALTEAIKLATGPDNTDFIDATELATALLGNAIATNMLLVGYAFQKGLLPVSLSAIEAAIDLNGVEVDFNKQAFLWGRRTAHDPQAVRRIIAPTLPAAEPDHDRSFVEKRTNDLVDYQNRAYADAYAGFVERVGQAEATVMPGSTALTDAVARSLFKLMAYKDEYEVARLYTDGHFKQALERQFEDGGKITVHLAPPLLSRRDPETGHLIKRTYGSWIFHAFRLLAGFKGLRGSRLDPFGYTQERRIERQLSDDYRQMIEELLQNLSPGNHAIAVEIAASAMMIRGYGHIKLDNLEKVKTSQAALLKTFRANSHSALAAAE